MSMVIIGAGQAGGRAAEAMRQAGCSGKITLIGAEPHLPYERPQLSKELLLGDSETVTFLKSAEDWEALGIDLVLGAAVTDCNPREHHVSLNDGRKFSYDRLLLATGTRPRRLPDLERGPLPCHYLRTADDGIAIRRALQAKPRVAIVGGGVIGLEVAAAAAKLGRAVTVIEAAPRLLARALPSIVSEYLQTQHGQYGVAFRTGIAPVAVDAEGVVLNDGSRVPADVILIGVGVEPVTDLSLSLGLEGEHGLKVDRFGRTDVEDVFAAGDVAVQWSPRHDRWMRIETWANAQDQAVNTARNMVGQEMAYQAPPWFWSDQYDCNLQVVGDPITDDQIIRGDPATGRFSVIGLRDGKVNGAAVINTPRDMAALRRMTATGQEVAAADLANPAIDLRRLITAKS